MSAPFIIRRALPDEAGNLSDLAMRSKAYWGYSPQFMASCRAELTVDRDQIVSKEFDYRVAMNGRDVVGFYALRKRSDAGFELEALFVSPGHMRCGIGRRLINHAIRNVSAQGGRILTIQGDPNAAKFYAAVGARVTGTSESASIPGRYLPVFQVEVNEQLSAVSEQPATR